MNKTVSIIAFGILFVGIYVGASSAEIMNTTEISNVESPDFIWGTINVDTPGQIFIKAWANDSGWINLDFYDQTGKWISSGINSYSYVATKPGTYTLKMSSTSTGKIQTISVSSNYQFSLMPRPNRIAFDLAGRNAALYGLNVNKEGLVFIKAWDNDGDWVNLDLYDQTGKWISSGINSYNFIASSTGIYTLKVSSTSTSDKIHNISLSSNYLFESSIPAHTSIAQTPTVSTAQPISQPTSPAQPISQPTSPTPPPQSYSIIDKDVIIALIGALATIIAAYFGYRAYKKK